VQLHGGGWAILRRMDARTRSELLQRFVGRTDVDEFALRVLGSFWDRPELQHLHPPHEEVLRWVRWNLDLMVDWLVNGRPLDEAACEQFRTMARARAEEGLPADLVPANYRRAARFAFAAMLERASGDERLAVLESADALFEYVDRVSTIYAAEYEHTQASMATSAEEVAARSLLDRLRTDQGIRTEDYQLADRIGFPIASALRPFALTASTGTANSYLGLAARLRERGVLAATDGRRVIGVLAAADPAVVHLPEKHVLAWGELVGRAELDRVLDELCAVVDIAAEQGRSGTVRLEDYLPELLLRRSPHLARRVVSRVYGPLADAELTRTSDRGLVWLAWLAEVQPAAAPAKRV
jgi:hypothetical protein